MLTRRDMERLWGSIVALGPRKLAMAGLVFAFSAIAILATSYLVGRPDLDVAYVGLSPSDAGRISRALGETNYYHEMSSDGSRLMTRRSETSRIRAFLAERGLPSNPGSGYELFDKVSPLGLTSFMQEITRVRALEGEIARTVQMLKGIRAARVHIVIGEQASFRRQRQTPSASVVIRSESAGDRSSADAVRHIVAAAVPGLAAGDVRVISSDGQVLASGADAANPGTERLVSLEKAMSVEVQNNIARTLSPQLGLDNFEVSVSSRLNIDRRQVNETTYSPETRVERSVRVLKETGSAQNSGGRANVSVEQNIPAEAGSAGAEQSRRASQKRDEQTNYEVGSRATAVVSEGYRVERLTVAVVVNAKRIATLTGSNATPDAVAKRIADIERLVASAAGVDTARGDAVTVSVVDFIDTPRSSEAVETESQVKRWLTQNTGQLMQIGAILAATALLVAFGIRPAVRALALPSSLAAAPSLGVGDAAPRLHGQAPAQGAEPARLVPATDGSRAPTLEPPTDMIRRMALQDPARAAVVLRRWMREGTVR